MPAGQVAINAVAPFGNIDVLVPDGVQVDVGGFTLFGSKKIAVGEATANESGGGDPGAGLQPLRERQGELVTLAGAAPARRSRSGGEMDSGDQAAAAGPVGLCRGWAFVSATASVRAATPVAASAADHRGRLDDRHRGAGGAVAGGLHR